MQERGTKKWTSLMMPEHIKMLEAMWEEDKDIEKPVLSEDQYEDMQQVLNESLEYSLEVSVSYYRNKRINSIVGKIKPPKNGRMEIKNDEDILFLRLEDIVGVEIM